MKCAGVGPSYLAEIAQKCFKKKAFSALRGLSRGRVSTSAFVKI
jgi:hypothetical protein